MTSMSSAVAYEVVAALVWLPRCRVLRPPVMARSPVTAASRRRWVSFSRPPEAAWEEAEDVRCPAAWHLADRAHPPVLTLLDTVALGEGYWQVHGRLRDGAGLHPVSGLARLRAPDAAGRLITAELTRDPSAAGAAPITLAALLVAPPTHATAPQGRLCR